jgi:hypothetical protein
LAVHLNAIYSPSGRQIIGDCDHARAIRRAALMLDRQNRPAGRDRNRPFRHQVPRPLAGHRLDTSAAARHKIVAVRQARVGPIELDAESIVGVVGHGGNSNAPAAA